MKVTFAVVLLLSGVVAYHIPKESAGDNHWLLHPLIWPIATFLAGFCYVWIATILLFVIGATLRHFGPRFGKWVWLLIKRYPWIATTFVGLLVVLIAFWATGREINKEFGLLDNHPNLFGPGPLFLRELSLGFVASLITLGSLALVLYLILSAAENGRKAREAERQATQRLLYEQRRAEEERQRLAAAAEEKRQREEAARKKRDAAARAASEAADRRFSRFMSQYDLDSDFSWYLGDDSFTTYFEGNWTFRHIRDRDSKEWGCSVIEERDGATEVVHYKPSGDSYGWTDEEGHRYVVNSNLSGYGGDKVWPLYRQYLEAYHAYDDWEDDEEEEEDEEEEY